ncbi:precorrin-3B synthase [Nocardia sp. CDC159]|uniref:Precorrin-3B synthase n=1 Tax=Nocardia pulmonis TaxID=2951408 RepID=A0A9X2E8B4_9NOCA|nr:MULTISPECIES: precorrin-3B synthase [Nocardia]MCM6775445.1 precorrin-3B synthase [Nocardia pulmonis]MCM6787821.1 precorrin-3B synthase [Nocardia sp. CDC159]
MTRSEPDSCPGVLRLHRAADGPLARIRLPGGLLRPDQLRALAEAARELGDGAIELTSRGNVQLRRMRDADALAARLAAADLLPSPTHERVRNIVASPLSGRVGGRTDVQQLVPLLDAQLRAAPRLAELPGRVLFTLDDGRGDVSGLGGDLGIHATDAEAYALLLGGRDSGIRLGRAEVLPVLVAAAHVFQDLRGDHWRLHEIPHGAARIVAALGLAPTAEPVELPVRHDIPVGWFTQADDRVALGAGVPLGSLPARTAEFLTAVDRPILITPWRSLIVPDLDEWAAEQVVRVLAPMGLIFDAESPWLLVTACAGKPGCAKSHTDVRVDAATAVASGRVHDDGPVLPSETNGNAAYPTSTTPAPGAELPAERIVATGRQHWSGCDRRCGRPRGPVTDIVATPTGYRVEPPRGA